ncbi:MAG: kynureninase/PvdN C-terminal domain-containing protein, partial [Gammaproteobacteria bacterium]
MPLEQLLLTNPSQFMAELKSHPDYLSLEMAHKLDALDPLAKTAGMFKIGKLKPFAGHSLGPVFIPVLDKINATAQLQEELHAGHFKDSHPEGHDSAEWFDCDRHKPSLEGAKQLLGFKEMHEFCFTASGLSQNLGMLADTFFNPKKCDWKFGRTKIVMLHTEFFSDQAIVYSVMKRAIKQAENNGCFESIKKPYIEDEILKIKPNKQGLYLTENIINTIKNNAKKIQMICLPDIVFSTGQRLELDKIFAEVGDIIRKNKIRVILDLAHTVGNRPINLESMPVTAAVGCGYKHLSGFAGSAFGIYVNRHVNLEEYPPLQGWKAVIPEAESKLFAKINSFDDKILEQKGGATAFRTSNPPPIALHPVQAFLTEFGKIGFDKCFNKSECLTQYLIALLQHHLQNKIKFVTPLEPSQRGATIAIQVKDGEDVRIIEEKLKKAGFEIDTRPPSIIRITAHYAYTKFAEINCFVTALTRVLDKKADLK